MAVYNFPNSEKNRQNPAFFAQTLKNTDFFSKSNSVNQAEQYYPKDLEIPNFQNQQQDFDMSQFQQDFSYLSENKNKAESSENSAEKFKNQTNLESMLNLLKNGGSGDLFSTLLAGGMMKNQNPRFVETFSKMLNKTETKKTQKSTNRQDSFEDM